MKWFMKNEEKDSGKHVQFWEVSVERALADIKRMLFGTRPKTKKYLRR